MMLEENNGGIQILKNEFLRGVDKVNLNSFLRWVKGLRKLIFRGFRQLFDPITSWSPKLERARGDPKGWGPGGARARSSFGYQLFTEPNN